MGKPRSVHRCESCGGATARWAGRCPTCGAWNSLVEEVVESQAGVFADARPGTFAGAGGGPVALCAVDISGATPLSTGLTELDQVLGGGFVPGSATLLGGEPGVGKSTLLLQVLRAVATTGATVVLVSAEESAAQVRLRAERLGPVPPTLLLLEVTDVRAVARCMEDLHPDLVVVDSIQAVSDPDVSGLPGGVPQVRACAEYLVRLAKTYQAPFVLVGHVTKDGALAGPRVLEHLVDTVMTVEGDRHHALRLVRATKHRFGPTGELGLFAMGDSGLAAVTDPHKLLLGDRRPGTPGSAVLPAIEGQRALLVEIQALRARASSETSPARRSAQGIDAGRLALLLAVLEEHAGIVFGHTDVFASAVGGVRVTEPAADLALVLALASAVTWTALPADVVAFGEVGLGGEIRQVPHAPRRLSEAARIGFRRALVPASCPDGPPGIELLRVASVEQAVGIALAVQRAGERGAAVRVTA
jgi:DNA repair protein RadA/Sms